MADQKYMNREDLEGYASAIMAWLSAAMHGANGADCVVVLLYVVGRLGGKLGPRNMNAREYWEKVCGLHGREMFVIGFEQERKGRN